MEIQLFFYFFFFREHQPMEKKLIEDTEEEEEETTLDPSEDEQSETAAQKEEEILEDQRRTLVMETMMMELPGVEKFFLEVKGLRCRTCGQLGHKRNYCALKKQLLKFSGMLGAYEEMQLLLMKAQHKSREDELDWLEQSLKEQTQALTQVKKRQRL